MGRMLPGDFHINRIKKAKEIMPEGPAETYEQLRAQIGLPNDAMSQSAGCRSSTAPVKIRMRNKE